MHQSAAHEMRSAPPRSQLLSVQMSADVGQGEVEQRPAKTIEARISALSAGGAKLAGQGLAGVAC